ncbi:MAG: hypothetical protein ACK4IX_02070 [Candidatus Sericytochromatia bacterium]
MIIKINNELEKEKEKVFNLLKDVFPKLTNEHTDKLFKLNRLYLQFNNKVVFQKIKDKLTFSDIKFEVTSVLVNLNKVASVVYPLSNDQSIYGLVVFYEELHTNKSSNVSILSIEKDKNDLVDFHSTSFCKACRKNVPQQITFCIFCGNQILTSEQIKNYSIKITQLNDSSSISLLIKQLAKISDKFSHLQMLEYFNKVPIILNFNSTEYTLNKLLHFLENLSVSYKLYSDSFSIDKIISGITNNQIYLDLIKFEDFLFDPIVSDLAKETIRNIKYPEIKDIVSNTLVEAYKVLEILSDPETSNEYIFKDIKKELNNLLYKFLKLISRYNKLKDYHISNPMDKLIEEISFISSKINESNSNLESSYIQILNVKHQELQNMEQISNNLPLLESEILSTISSFRMLRSKILNINFHDIQGKKGDLKDIKALKESIILKIHSMEEVLSL